MTESELLFSGLFNYSRDELYNNRNRRLSRRECFSLADALSRRFKGEPLQYILGKTEFMGLSFRITPDVFIPRPETEILVEAAIRAVKSESRKVRKILDIGTGSGCIAVSLAKFLPASQISAVDISQKALQIAKQNALLNNVEINFLLADLFSLPELEALEYDLIVSNPAYIPTAEISSLQEELSFEPRVALDGGSDGLDFYRRIIEEAPAYIKQGGFLIMEMGHNQCSAIKDLFNSSGEFELIEIVRDYNHIDRVVVTRLK